jgi:hypothetical protein
MEVESKLLGNLERNDGIRMSVCSSPRESWDYEHIEKKLEQDPYLGALKHHEA